MIPFDKEFSKRSAEDFIEHVLIEKLNAKTVSVGENFRFGAKAKGDVEMLAVATTASRPASCPWSRWTARPSPRPGSGGWSPPATSSTRCTASGAVHARGRGRDGRPARAGSWASRPRTSSPTTRWSCRARRLRRLRERPPGRGQRRGPADVRDRARPADRVLPDRLRRRPLRAEPAGRLRASACAARSASRAVEALIEAMKSDVERAREVCAAYEGGAPSLSRGSLPCREPMPLTKDKRPS